MNISILGAGNFGTVLAQLLADHHDVTMIKRGDSLRPITTANLLLLALPVKAYDDICHQLRALAQLPPMIICSKGMNEQGLLPSEIIARHLSEKARTAVLAGPNFAFELAKQLPTASVLASHDPALIKQGQEILAQPFWRIYANHDPVGTELCGAMKNILAIAGGMVLGKGLGHNAVASLLTRGLHEMAQLLSAEQAVRNPRITPSTAYGLAGVGDLVLTATSERSRNTILGMKLARGVTLAEALAQSPGVSEGYHAAREIHKRAQHLGIDLPIVAMVASILQGGLSVDRAISQLLARPLPPTE